MVHQFTQFENVGIRFGLLAPPIPESAVLKPVGIGLAKPDDILLAPRASWGVSVIPKKAFTEGIGGRAMPLLVVTNQSIPPQSTDRARQPSPWSVVLHVIFSMHR